MIQWTRVQLSDRALPQYAQSPWFSPNAKEKEIKKWKGKPTSAKD